MKIDDLREILKRAYIDKRLTISQFKRILKEFEFSVKENAVMISDMHKTKNKKSKK